MTRPLVVIERFPVQYHAPVYSRAASLGVPIVTVYGNDMSLTKFVDKEFGCTVSWGDHFNTGTDSRFLVRTNGAPVNYAQMRANGLNEVLRELNPAAILLTGYASPFDRDALRSAFACNVPVMMRAETTDHARSRSFLKRQLRDLWLSRTYRRMSGLLYIGTESLDHYLRLRVPKSKLFHSPYCVDTTPFEEGELGRTKYRECMRRELNIDDQQILLLFVGKVSPRKGVDLLAPAVRMLPEDIRRRIVLGFLGDGELAAEITNQCRELPSVETRFLGFQKQSELSRYYHASDVAVLPSRIGETWGLVVNEALHHGIACISSRMVGSTKDLISPGQTGEVFETGDAHSLHQAILRVLPYATSEVTRIHCRERIKKFTVDAAAEGIAAAWSKIST